ncbi:serine/threonine protein kinase [Actinospica durhamensis]|uniref:Serine/threonine protein kinase n=1 Tax=Actinospica durhamensis TaxID=1508375 RepID=A0A941EVA0_9ACTN|nr:serine/threonine-protein kinase [Actinospica durhamensis]MBR7834574.1 serine/threonine protein kinase [Actinospica durhamensis]
MTEGTRPQAYGADFEAPERIGTFEVLGVLGGGAMGRVFLGYDQAVGLAAVKVIRPELAADATYRERFVREIRAARRVSGTHTARVIGAEPFAAPLWLATEYVAAPTLGELVEACGPLPEDCVRRLADGCIRALMDVHRAGLVHRDVKPGNILVTASAPLLLDFGLAYATDSGHLTRSGTHPGTPAFMAPEQINRREEPTAATDVYALGATLIFAACGHLPFPGPGVEATIYQLMTSAPDLSGVPERLVATLTACLARDPADRPACAELLDALAADIGDTPLPEAGLALIANRAAEGERLREQYGLADDAGPGRTHVTHVGEQPSAGHAHRNPRKPPRRKHNSSRRGAGRTWMAVAASSTAVLGIAAGLVYSVVHAWPTPSPVQTSSSLAAAGVSGQNPPPPNQGGQGNPPPNAPSQSAAYPATLTVTPGTGGTRGVFTVRGTGWPPGRLVWIILETSAEEPFSVYAAADGSILATVDPATQEHRANATPGDYVVEAEAGPIQALASFTVSVAATSEGTATGTATATAQN